MNLQAKSLILQGFKSFKSSIEFDFTSLHPGLHFVTGLNLAEPALGENGVGKSSLWEGLCWVLYGKTSMNLKAGNIHNWTTKKQTVGRFKFVKENVEYEVERSWNPNKLLLIDDNGYQVIEQDTIDKLVGLNFFQFLYSVYISQFTSKFFDLEPSDKLSIFSEITGADIWINYSDKAKSMANKLETQKGLLDLTLANKRGQLQSIEAEDYSEASKEWEALQTGKKTVLTELIKNVLTNITESEKQIEVITTSIASDTNKLDMVDKDLIVCDVEKDKYTVTKNEVNKAITTINTERKAIQKEIKKFEDAGDNCPYCYQTVNPKHKAKHIKEFKLRDKELETALKVQEDKLNNTINYMENITQHKNKLSSKRKAVVEVLDALKVRLTGAKTNMNNYQFALENHTNRKEELNNEQNPYDQQEADRQNKLKLLTGAVGKLKETIRTLEEMMGVYSFWIKGFKDIRLLVIEETLKEFELFINDNLQRLSMTDWEIQLGIDTETKSNTIKKGFTVLVKSPINKDLKPFECWSGGEGQRLRLAGTVGLIDLIHSRKGTDWDIEIYDEPTTWLSGKGEEDLLELLHERAEETGKNVFLIDHRNFKSYGGFQSIISIVKDKNGSRLEISNV